MNSESDQRVSVVVPVYNRQALCERALRSILAQGASGIEIIVVDDCSQPPFVLSAELAAAPSIRLLRHDDNRGASAARNTGIAAARGEWIALLDSDDYWLPDALRPRLAVAEQTFTATGDPMIVHAAGFVSDNHRTQQRSVRVPIESADPIDFASGCWFAPGSTLIARKEAFDRVGPYDSTLGRLEDLDWFLRLALSGGRLQVWNGIAAVVEIGDSTPIAAVEAAARQLQTKFADRSSPMRLAPHLLRHLDAYLDVERAASSVAARHWWATTYFLARSFVRVPRTSIHLKRFWDYPTSTERLTQLE